MITQLIEHLSWPVLATIDLNFIHALFGGGITLMSIYLTMVALDLITGYLYALKDHSWLSSINFEGLLLKFTALMTIIAAAGLDKAAPILDVQLPINVALIWTGLLCIYEFGSILENANGMGLKVTWLMKWLEVFQDRVGTEEEQQAEKPLEKPEE